MRNFITIESLRGWMAWWVVITHALQLLGAGGGSGPIDAVPLPLLKLMMAGHTGVLVFIIISGFVITHLLIGKQERYPIYLLRRFLRIAPIYIFCLVLAILLADFYKLAYVENAMALFREERLGRLAQEQDNFWGHILLHVSMLHGAISDSFLPHASATFLTPAWSLSLEWQFYLIAPLLISIALRSELAAFMLAAILLIIKYSLHHSGLRWQYESLFFLAGDLFMVGIASRMILERINQNKSPLGYLLLVAALLVQVDVKATIIWVFFFCLTMIEVGFLPIRSRAISWLHKIIALNSVIRSLGQWSYSTYLIHIPLFSVLVGLYVRHVGAENVSQLIVASILAGCMPLLILISAFLYNFVEKPPIRLGQILIARRQSQVTTISEAKP
ncbi:MAG TPA: acyltransferase [Paenirhodobacter sp.]